jgi:hypothetical protein
MNFSCWLFCFKSNSQFRLSEISVAVINVKIDCSSTAYNTRTSGIGKGAITARFQLSVAYKLAFMTASAADLVLTRPANDTYPKPVLLRRIAVELMR